MESIMLHTISLDEFFEKLRTIIKEEIKIAMQQDQLLTKVGAMKMMGIGSAIFTKAVNVGIVKPHKGHSFGERNGNCQIQRI